MPRVEYIRVAQGFRPYTNPQPLAGLRGLGALKDLSRARGLGAVDPNCASGMPYDVNGNPCPTSVSGVCDPGIYCAPGQTDIYGNVTKGSIGLFQAALPWIAGAALIILAAK
jgi:hypothetical protein